MRFLTSVYTDVGIKKKTNQDSSSILVANTPCGAVCMAIVCDGMGGLEKGELASAHIVKMFKLWFETDFPRIMQMDDYGNIRYQWNEIVQRENEHIALYGANNSVNMGTTLTVSLFLKSKIYTMHVGDTRLYEILNTELIIHTEDQTLVAREVKRGNLTPEQAEADPRRNVLLQCIGASKVVEPQYFELQLKPNRTYMICSDGFRHKINEDEIINGLCPHNNPDKALMQKNSALLVNLVKQRKETDNITLALVRTLFD